MSPRVVGVATVSERRGGSSAFDGIPVSWFCLVENGADLTTPRSMPLAHSQKPLLDAVALEGRGRNGLQLEALSLYSMFCTMRDSAEKQDGMEAVSCRYLLLEEPSLRTSAGPEATDQLAALVPLEEYFEQRNIPRLLLGCGDGKHQEENLQAMGLGGELDRLVSFFDGKMREITPAQRCVVTNCVHVHGVFVLGILLADGACTPAQYADGVLAVNGSIPGVFGGVSKRDVLRARKQLVSDAELMLRFRDLADGRSPGATGPRQTQRDNKRQGSRRSKRQRGAGGGTDR
jgi:hypothetical protein